MEKFFGKVLQLALLPNVANSWVNFRRVRVKIKLLRNKSVPPVNLPKIFIYFCIVQPPPNVREMKRLFLKKCGTFKILPIIFVTEGKRAQFCRKTLNNPAKRGSF
jgi:hypothetical protein